MNKFRVASRFDERYVGEKCPQCKMAFQDFIEFGDELLACFACGVAFIPRMVKDAEWSGKKAQLEKQLAEMTDVESEDDKGLRCTFPGCGKVCKSKLGLMAHQRSHNEK